ncbi:MAG: histidine phosphatase family protein [Acidimicrobiia bacterium]|nr:histidine phosphatase family protein [Acidimicrobiia bacterium]
MTELLLMRHAKSDRANWRGVDHERPLNERGVRSARAVGHHLADTGRQPDRVVSSTAVRARTTAELVVDAAGWSVAVDLDDRLYGAGAMELIGAVRETSVAVRRLLVVGHEPTWSMAASGLIGGVRLEMPTAAVAVVGFDVPWPQIEWDGGLLVEHVLARELLVD